MQTYLPKLLRVKLPTPRQGTKYREPYVYTQLSFDRESFRFLDRNRNLLSVYEVPFFEMIFRNLRSTEQVPQR